MTREIAKAVRPIPLQGMENAPVEQQADLFRLLGDIEEVLQAGYGAPRHKGAAQPPVQIESLRRAGAGYTITLRETATAKHYPGYDKNYHPESLHTQGTVDGQPFYAVRSSHTARDKNNKPRHDERSVITTRHGLEAIIGYVNSCLVPETGLEPINPTDYPALGLDNRRFKADLTYPQSGEPTLQDKLDAEKQAALPASDGRSHADRVRDSIAKINQQIGGRG